RHILESSGSARLAVEHPSARETGGGILDPAYVGGHVADVTAGICADGRHGVCNWQVVVTMRITYVPQRLDVPITCTIDGERSAATVDGITDSFAFSSLPAGEAADIRSVLNPCPVLSVRRVNGELRVTLLRAIGPRPSDPQELEAWKRLWSDDLEVVIGG